MANRTGKTNIVKLFQEEDATIHVRAPKSVVDELQAQLQERGASLQRYLRLHLISLRNKANIVYSLGSVIQFGKYRGVQVEEIIRCDPDYVSWLLGNVVKFSLAEDATTLLDDMMKDTRNPEAMQIADGLEELGLHAE
jgi:hypothetical protein